MGKRKPEDILGDIEASDAEEAADRALAMPADKRAAELAAAGVTPADTAAAGDAWHERMQRAAIDEARRRAEVEARQAVTRPTRRPAWGVLVAAALAVAAVIALFFATRRGSEEPVAQPPATATVPSRPAAAGPVDADVEETRAPATRGDAGPSSTEKPRLK